MRIVQLIPGAGDSFYCENCLRDAALIGAFSNLGHDVIMIPMYLPLPLETEESVAETPIFFGGVNVYLQQKSALFRKTPRWLDRFFDSPNQNCRTGVQSQFPHIIAETIELREITPKLMHRYKCPFPLLTIQQFFLNQAVNGLSNCYSTDVILLAEVRFRWNLFSRLKSAIQNFRFQNLFKLDIQWNPGIISHCRRRLRHIFFPSLVLVSTHLR